MDTTTGPGPRRLATGGMVGALGPPPVPTEHPDLRTSGRPRGDKAKDLRSISDARSALTVLGAWAQVVAVIAAGAYVGHWAAWSVVAILMFRSFSLLAILNHEAAHKLLFSNLKVNDLVGRWLLASPAFVPFHVYRRAHLAHHRDEFGPEEPDLAFYANYPVPAASMIRKLRRDAVGISGVKNLTPLVGALRSSSSRPTAISILAVQLAIGIVLTLVGSWWWYPVLWLLPWLTGWRVINRLRSISEHGGMERNDDRRHTTHHVAQGPLARFWIAPYNTGWHLAHHMDQNVPWRQLPAYHAVLETADWVGPSSTWPNYRALWKALSSTDPTSAELHSRNP